MDPPVELHGEALRLGRVQAVVEEWLSVPTPPSVAREVASIEQDLTRALEFLRRYEQVEVRRAAKTGIAVQLVREAWTFQGQRLDARLLELPQYFAAHRLKHEGHLAP